MLTRDTAAIANFYRDGLLNDVLPFWLSNGIDEEFGGICTALDRDGSRLDSDKSVWQQGRFTWLLAKLYNTVDPGDSDSHSRWLRTAESGANFLDQHCFDPSDGRMWFHVTREGRPIRKRRYQFSESFAAIAFAQYSRAADSDYFRDRALACFHTFVGESDVGIKHRPKYETTRPTRGIGTSMIQIVTAQELREAIRFEDADRWIDAGIRDIATYFVDDELEVVWESIPSSNESLSSPDSASDANDARAHFDCRTLNPGHAIEAAWFIMYEGHVSRREDWVQLGLRMLDWMWSRGWDNAHGGLLYFTSVDGRPIQEYWHDMKFWWPHNEAIIASLLAWLLTGDKKYADIHEQVHNWAFEHFADREFGEWFGYLRRDGSVSNELKGNLWKGPFHLPRMQLLGWQWLEGNLSGTVTFPALRQ
ncbi:MAG: AGE family epimerase/isomerase [Aureliella sp.]